MNSLKTIVVLFFIFLSTLSYSQKRLSNFVEMSVTAGLTHDFEPTGLYDSRNQTANTVVQSKSFARSKGYSFGIGGLLFKETGIKFSGGRTEYGFKFDGNLENSSTSFNDQFKVIYLEFYVGLIQKFRLNESFKLLFDGGVAFHTGADRLTDNIVLYVRNSRSILSFAGIEIPMAGNNFFINAGLQFRFPMRSYNKGTFSPTEYRPYFIGLKIGMNFQF